MLGQSGVDGDLVAIKDRLAFQHPERILHRLSAGGFVLFLIEERASQRRKPLTLSGQVSVCPSTTIEA